MRLTKQKPAYVCGPLTELPIDQQSYVKDFYESIAGVCFETTGIKAFVPHEHYDPVRHSSFSPQDVDSAERRQVCCTSVLIAVAIAPSWGGGIEVEMANQNNVPVLIVCPKNKKVSRLLLGNPAVMDILYYASEKEALTLLKGKLGDLFCATELASCSEGFL